MRRTRTGTLKPGAESLPSLGLVLALLASTCVSALLALLLCCHVATCRVCRPQRIHVQDRIGHVEERMVSQRILEHVQERLVSQAAARAVDILYREAATCRRGEDQVLCPTSLTIAMNVS